MRNDIRHSLQEIATKYKLVLFDTCSICDYTKNTENLSSIQQKEIESYIQYKSYTFLRNFILNGDGNTLFFIPEVISELEKARKIKFTKNFKGKRRFASFRNFSNNTKYAFARNKSFVKIIRERGLILRLT